MEVDQDGELLFLGGKGELRWKGPLKWLRLWMKLQFLDLDQVMVEQSVCLRGVPLSRPCRPGSKEEALWLLLWWRMSLQPLVEKERKWMNGNYYCLLAKL